MEKLNENLLNNEHIIKELKENLTGTIYAIYTRTLDVLSGNVIEVMKEQDKEVNTYYHLENNGKKFNMSLVDLLLYIEEMNKYINTKIVIFKETLLKMNKDILEVIKDNEILDNDKQNELGVLLNTVSESIFNYLDRMDKRNRSPLPEYMLVKEVKDVLVIDKEGNNPKAWLSVWGKLLIAYTTCIGEDTAILKNLIGSLLTIVNNVKSTQE